MTISRYFVLLVFTLFISSCSGNQSLESRFSPDASLTEEEEINNNDEPQGQDMVMEEELELPENFPEDVPVYEGARLIRVENNSFIWTSADPINLIVDSYEQGLLGFDWQVERVENDSLVATKENDGGEVSITMGFEVVGDETEFSLVDSRLSENTTTPEGEGDDSGQDSSPTVGASESLQQLVQVGVIDGANESLNGGEVISRRDYARWLVKANNVIFSGDSGKLIRLAEGNDGAVFNDVPTGDPDFPYIQGLANAGLIPSSLTNDPSAIAFNPDQPLTRESLIAWKVPFDFRQSFPTTTLDNIRETWGFQDANQMSPELWQKLYIDWQNGDNANVRRVFGFTKLFQPQKTVSKSEAATTLHRFGYQGDVRSLDEL
ncbi:S-layer homology domain-containing protein [Cyanobacterium stanieri LEGE 03274]|uniref:S-layer homology domain-containing protein n=1 Tax=Cyanobacterium stanieri LEGE 03274 TaxID=1828756 RepID=A0ABR9V5Q9_9CHRO|nr:S-layer homology domain-containing protein [Cyanobacterium stanieri]MBE9223229.1 S-layer homology domain-containing protein [Cyanobacterium stanieri LEGE 03274]